MSVSSPRHPQQDVVVAASLEGRGIVASHSVVEGFCLQTCGEAILESDRHCSWRHALLAESPTRPPGASFGAGGGVGRLHGCRLC